MPGGARGIVVFAHGSGSSRHSPRNQRVAEELQRAGLATLLVDLLTPEEEAVDVHTAQFRFDIPGLARRLMAISAWLENQPETSTLRLGYFGASTGAGAALIAAAEQPDRVGAKDTFLGGAQALLFPIRWPEPFGLVMVESLACGTPAQHVSKLGETDPTQRPAEPAELAPAYAFLASPEASYVSGAILGVTGGKPLP